MSLWARPFTAGEREAGDEWHGGPPLPQGQVLKHTSAGASLLFCKIRDTVTRMKYESMSSSSHRITQ